MCGGGGGGGGGCGGCGNVNAPQAGETLDIRVLVDRPIVEIFVNKGRAAFVSADANFTTTSTTSNIICYTINNMLKLIDFIFLFCSVCTTSFN